MGVEQGLLALVGAADFGGAYEIEQSLRFNKADTPYLNKVFTSAGDEQKFTISFWFKTTNVGNSTASNLAGAGDDGSNYFLIDIEKASVGEFLHIFNYTPSTGYEFDLKTTRLLRDPSAWMHLVLAVDTTQATASDRAKVWLNGVRETSFTTENYPNQNRTTMWWGGNTSNGIALANQETAIGRRPPGGPEYANAYIAEFNSIDGQYLTHEDFGEFDDNGVWRPIKYTGTYTGNSFYLKFDAADVDGDSSGLGNDFTANNFTTSGTGTDVMSDTPTTNWCTLNPLDVTNGGFGLRPNALSNGNLVDSSTSNALAKGTLAVDSGKWYFEYTGWTSTSFKVGVALVPSTSSPFSNTDLKLLNYNGQYQSNAPTGTAGGTTYGGSISSTDIIGVAVDMDNRTIAWSKNGQYGDGSGNWDETYANASKISLESTGGVTPCCLNGSTTASAQTFNFGQRDFEYTPPTDFLPLNTANLPAPDIKDGGKHFNTVLYNGNGSTQSITGVGFQPDWSWIKVRTEAYSHDLYDAVRGVQKSLASNGTTAEVTQTAGLSSFDTDGFSLGDRWNVNKGSTTYVSWNWLAGGSGSSIAAGSIDGTNPTIASTVSANPTAGFSIVSYTGNVTAGATVGHGLGVPPDMMIIKHRNSTYNWVVYHSSMDATAPEDYYIALNDYGERALSTNIWQSTAPTSTTFKIGDMGQVNADNQPYIAYCFAEIESYSKFGSYTGNGSSDGPFVFCGFRPRWIMLKKSNTSTIYTSWSIYDTARDSYNVSDAPLYANVDDREGTNSQGTVESGHNVDILSNGFKLRDSNQIRNTSGDTYIFAAFAENPFGGSGVSPATAR